MRTDSQSDRLLVAREIVDLAVNNSGAADALVGWIAERGDVAALDKLAARVRQATSET